MQRHQRRAEPQEIIMVRRRRQIPDPDPPPNSRRGGKRPKATLAAWVAAGVGLAEVLIRILDR